MPAAFRFGSGGARAPATDLDDALSVFRLDRRRCNPGRGRQRRGEHDEHAVHDGGAGTIEVTRT
jgi:hypothetical protein